MVYIHWLYANNIYQLSFLFLKWCIVMYFVLLKVFEQLHWVVYTMDLIFYVQYDQHRMDIDRKIGHVPKNSRSNLWNHQRWRGQCRDFVGISMGSTRLRRVMDKERNNINFWPVDGSSTEFEQSLDLMTMRNKWGDWNSKNGGWTSHNGDVFYKLWIRRWLRLWRSIF